jgi:hypothetical protein
MKAGTTGTIGLVILVAAISFVSYTLYQERQKALYAKSGLATIRQEVEALASESDETDKEWKVIASWSGSGIRSTESFQIQNREWRVRWRTQNEVFPGAGILQLYVYDQNDNLVTLAANTQGPSSDVSYVRGGPGRYYIEISSGNIDWRVQVEDFR